MDPLKKNLEKRSWDEFRAAGLLFAVNSTLHMLGWALAIEQDTETKEIVAVHPCRTKFRGFDETAQAEEHEKLAKYLADNAKNFPEEIK